MHNHFNNNGCGPFECVPKNDCNCGPCVPPCPPPIPPVNPLCGFTTHEQMEHVISRVNDCIRRWNDIQANCYEAMRQCVGAATSNNVYYEREEVGLNNGYSDVDGSAYSFIDIAPCDKRGNPIHVKLALAFKNTSNANVRQDIEDVSYLENANAIITAVSPDKTGWEGTAMYQGCPIAGTPNAEKHIAGFTKTGAMRVFPGDTDILTLQQNCMVDCIGDVIHIVSNGEVTEEAKALTTKSAITAIGYKSSCGHRVFFFCGNQDAVGMQGVTVANVLKDMGCTEAVITSILVNSAEATYSNGMEYLGTMTAAPNQYIEPSNCAYWVVSKRPFDGWCNEFTAEIADLVQECGATQNKLENLYHGLEIVRETANEALSLAQDNADRITVVEGDLNQAEADIDALENRMGVVETRVTTLENRCNTLETNLATEIQERKDADTQLSNQIQQEVTRATERENQIQNALNKEIQDRTNADVDLSNAISAEILARKTADTQLETEISAEEARARAEESAINTRIDNLIDGTTDTPYVKKAGDTMTGQLTMASNISVTLGRAPTADLEAATKKYVDDLVAGGTTPGGDVSKEYVDQQIANVQSQLDGKVSKTGDSMTGNLDMGNNKIVNPVLQGGSTGVKVDNGSGDVCKIINVATPEADTDAATKKYVDDSVAAATGGDYVRRSGDTMTGNLVMSGGAKVTQTASPVEGSDVVNKTYVDTAIQTQGQQYVKKTGDTMSGTLNMGAGAKVTIQDAPSNNVDAANKGYVDRQDQALGTRIDSVEGDITTIEGDIQNIETNIANITNGNTDLPYVKRAGDTMTGPLVLSADPNTAMQAATKRYVDSKIVEGGGGVSEKNFSVYPNGIINFGGYTDPIVKVVLKTSIATKEYDCAISKNEIFLYAKDGASTSNNQWGAFYAVDSKDRRYMILCLVGSQQYWDYTEDFRGGNFATASNKWIAQSNVTILGASTNVATFKCWDQRLPNTSLRLCNNDKSYYSIFGLLPV